MKNLYLKFLLLMISMSSVVMATEATKGSIAGEVIDRDTKQEILGAVIEVMNTGIFAATDVHGSFVIEGLDAKTYNLKISAPYYVYNFKTDVVVNGKQSTKIVVELKLASYETEEVFSTSLINW